MSAQRTRRQQDTEQTALIGPCLANVIATCWTAFGTHPQLDDDLGVALAEDGDQARQQVGARGLAGAEGHDPSVGATAWQQYGAFEAHCSSVFGVRLAKHLLSSRQCIVVACKASACGLEGQGPVQTPTGNR